LITNSTLFGSSIGKSPGFTPFRIHSFTSKRPLATLLTFEPDPRV
jgi:hypothetical protein